MTTSNGWYRYLQSFPPRRAFEQPLKESDQMTTIYGYMWDSATQDFPKNSKLNALYYNGLYAHKPYSVGPGKVWIDVFGTAYGNASILQIDGTAAEVTTLVNLSRSWVVKRSPIGAPTIYCNRSQLPRVQAELHGLYYYIWLSTLDGTIPAAVTGGGTLAAVQYKGAAQTGINADQSAVINDTWWKLHASK